MKKTVYYNFLISSNVNKNHWCESAISEPELVWSTGSGNPRVNW